MNSAPWAGRQSLSTTSCLSSFWPSLILVTFLRCLENPYSDPPLKIPSRLVLCRGVYDDLPHRQIRTNRKDEELLCKALLNPISTRNSNSFLPASLSFAKTLMAIRRLNSILALIKGKDNCLSGKPP